MKKVILLSGLIVSCFNMFAQYDYYTTIKTPTNVSIEAIHRVEYSQNQLAQIEAEAADWIDDHKSQAVKVADASRTYNCHNYAWHNSDGGGSLWVNQNDQDDGQNLSKYWSGSSPTYQQTTISRAAKAFYSNGDHSARVISSNLFESKWGEWPRYQHPPGDCPYTSTGLQYYYIPVEGDNLICTSKTYSTLSIFNATYNWSGEKVSTSGTSYSTTATKTGNGAGWIFTEISSPYSGTTVKSGKKTFWAGPPSSADFDILNVDFYGENYLYEGMTNQLIANDYAYQDITEWEWDYGGWYHWEVTSSKYISFVEVPTFTYRDISVRAKNQCPGASNWYTERFYPYEGYFLVFSPNPSTGETVLSIESASTEKTFDETTEWELDCIRKPNC